MTKEKISKKSVMAAIVICFTLGGLGAYLVASEPIAYIASMTHGIIVLFLLTPAVLTLICVGIAFLAGKKVGFAVVFFVSSVFLPGSYFGVLILLGALGLAQYKNNPINEMSPIGSELKQRIVFVFDTEASQDEIRIFDETVLRKTIPQPNGILLEFADGVCNFSYPETQSKAIVVDVPFCANATEEQKDKIRNEIISSPLIHTAFEDVTPGEVRKLK